MLKLTELDHLPEAFFGLRDARDLHTLMPNPTLVYLSGQRGPRLHISVLIHGNEVTGFHAVQQLLAKYKNRPLPRSLSVFFGNVTAAAQGRRRLDGQPDYNRVWPGHCLSECDETHLMAQVEAKISAGGLFACIDVHNNTGRNPYYSCLAETSQDTLKLARLFSGQGLLQPLPGAQASALSRHCPAVTVECGQPGIPAGIAHTLHYLDTVLNLESLPEPAVTDAGFKLYRAAARVTLPEEYGFSFSRPEATIRLPAELDLLNFQELPAGTVLAETSDPAARFQAWDDNRQEVGGRYFEVKDGGISLRQAATPAMLTLDETIIRQDCLCYLMERISLEDAS